MVLSSAQRSMHELRPSRTRAHRSPTLMGPSAAACTALGSAATPSPARYAVVALDASGRAVRTSCATAVTWVCADSASLVQSTTTLTPPPRVCLRHSVLVQSHRLMPPPWLLLFADCASTHCATMEWALLQKRLCNALCSLLSATAHRAAWEGRREQCTTRAQFNKCEWQRTLTSCTAIAAAASSCLAFTALANSELLARRATIGSCACTPHVSFKQLAGCLPAAKRCCQASHSRVRAAERLQE